MGAWGYSVLENDAALDVLDRWKEWVESPNCSGYEKAMEKFFNRWGDAIKYGDLLTNSEIIALLGIHFEKTISVPENLKNAAVTAISLELEDNQLNAWDDPEKREEALISLLDKLGAKPRKVSKPLFFRDPTIQYRTLDSAKSKLLALSKDLYQRNTVNLYNLPFKKLPKFLKLINRVMGYGLAEKDYNIAERASSERMLMMAWYVGIGAGLTEKELEELLDKIIRNRKS